MSEPGWSARPVLRSSPDGAATHGEEAVAVEAPVALLFNGVSHVVMMATPLNLAELGLNPTIIADGLVGSSNRIATQWVAEKCKTPLDEVLHNCVSIFKACIEMARRGAITPP